ncbi:hypothetical protein [uncultured Azohydromonas sp.]|jgi:hypothetical protein|uniref:hypothetical protein n=1 Tax=uncultured Azohydromonas sp. TaxID=487342 RepID=UPI002626BF92|nr:hypothetical protein [uncultured Azohydromonas sp.]
MKKLGSQLRDAMEAAGLGSSRQAGSAKPSAGTGATGPVRQTDRDWVPQAWLRDGRKPMRAAAPSPGHATTIPTARKQNQPTRPLAGQQVSTTLSRTSATPAVRAPETPRSRLVEVGPFHPHTLFADGADECEELPALASSGIERQLTTSPRNATDLILGLDFGTSATKVVIRDAYAATSVFPVRLRGHRAGIDGYLLPSSVFKNGNVYSLERGAVCIADLKLALLACPAPSPVTEFNHCCAFLALVIRRARGWLFTEHADVYGHHELNWRLNLGLAARSYEDSSRVDLFRRLAWAAANLAADASAQEITGEAVDAWRVRSLTAAAHTRAEQDCPVEFAFEDVDTVPEVSAQLQGFMASARWDWQTRPVMMLVDIGAGTVDSALFHVRIPQGGSGVLTFYSSRVEPNGAMNLHRERVSWLQGLLSGGETTRAAREHLSSIALPTGRLRAIPDSVADYLPGYKLDVIGSSVDDEFRTNRYRRQVAGSIHDAKVGKGVTVHQLQKVPLLLCGGGSRMHFYAGIAETINRTPNWHVSVEAMHLPVPRDLTDSGWHAEDFDRLSVAYGLSLAGGEGTTLGRIVRAMEVPSVATASAASRNESGFVSKDQM